MRTQEKRGRGSELVPRLPCLKTFTTTREPNMFTRLLLIALFLLPTSAFAQHRHEVALRDFADANGNGQLDCGELVEFNVVVSNPNPPESGVLWSGRLTVPDDASPRFSYLSISQDFTATDDCTATVVQDGPKAIFDYSCIPRPNAGTNYLLTMVLRGYATGLTGPLRIIARDQLATPEPQPDRLITRDFGMANCTVSDLRLTKTDFGASVAPGATVAYTLTATNLGTASALGSTLSETVPAHSTFSPTASSPGWDCPAGTGSGSLCTLPLGTVVAGGSAARIFAVTASTDIPPGVTQLLNSATVSSASPDDDPSDNTATDSTPLLPGIPDLVLSKTASATSASPGSLITWSLQVTNQGNASAQDVTLSETLPGETSFVPGSSSPGWDCGTSPCTLSIGPLAAGASASRTFTVRVASPVSATLSSITNTACVSTSSASEPRANNCDTVSTPVDASPSLAIDKVLVSGSGRPGSLLVWDLIVSNGGDQDASGVSIHETVPTHTTFSSQASSPGWGCPSSAAGASCVLSIGSLPGGGGNVVRRFAVTVANPLPAGATTIHNTACVSTGTAPNSCDSIDIPTDGRPVVNLTKTLESGTAQPGQVLVFRLALQNTGDQDAAGVVVTETVPAHTTWVPAASDPAWTCSGSTPGSNCSRAVSLVPAGQTVSVLFAVRLPSPLPAGLGEISNTACVELPPAAPACDEIDVPTDGAPVLALDKVRSDGLLRPGEIVTYTISVSNSGNQDAAGVIVTETLPELSTFEPEASSPGWFCSPTPRAPSTCRRTLPSLPAGAAEQAVLAIRLDASLPASLTMLRNSACAAEGPRTACDETQDPIAGEPQIGLEKTYSGGPLRPGAPLPFTLRVTNSGDRAASGLTLQERIPTGASFSAANSDPAWACDGTVAGSVCTLSIPELAAGASRSFEFALVANNPLPEGLRQISNSACVLMAGSSAACDEEATPLEARAELTLSDELHDDKNSDGFLSQGDVLRYTLKVENPSVTTLTALTLTVALDTHVQLMTGTVVTSGGSVFSGNSTGDASPVVTIPALAPGESVVVTFDVLAGDLSQVREIPSQASVSGSNFEDEPSDDPATEADDDPTVTPLFDPRIPTVPTAGATALAALAAGLALFATRRLRRERTA